MMFRYGVCLMRGLLKGSRAPRDLHSFPTLLSSDLDPPWIWPRTASGLSARPTSWAVSSATTLTRPSSTSTSATARCARSEEHTSELQSRQYLVCRLLLEKKKNRL